MFDLIYSGQSALQSGCFVKERPDIPVANKHTEDIYIPGRGTLYREDGSVDDIDIPVTFSFIDDPDHWNERLRNIRIWLNSEGTGELSFNDDPDFFYKVKRITFDAAERTAWRIGEIEVTFTCEGYQYAASGTEWISCTGRKELKNNYGNSKPVLTFTSRTKSYVYINDYRFEVQTSGAITIDTERMESYVDASMRNSIAVGDYEKMVLVPGMNVIRVSNSSDIDIPFEILPNWRI